jgi:hypothetical protein
MNYLLKLLARCLFEDEARYEIAERWEAAKYSAMLAINDELHRDSCLMFTNQVAAEAGSEWVQVAPWGEHPNAKGIQVTTRESVQPMIQAFNELKAKQGANFRGAPIYDRHPTKDDLRAAIKPMGRIMAMECRADGLYLNRKLNTIGLENDKEGYHPYPSIGWYVKPIGNGKVVPIGIDHVAMVEHPNIGSVPAWTNDADGDRDNSPTNETETNTMNPEIKKKLGLKDDCTQEEYDAAVTGMHDKAAIAEAAKNEAEKRVKELETLLTNAKADAETKIKDLEKAVNVATEKHVDAKLQLAINEGRITPAAKDEWKPKLLVNADDPTFLAIKPRMSTGRLVVNRQTVSEGQLAVNDARSQLGILVNERFAKNKSAGLIAANAAVWKDPANKALVDAALAE